MNLGEIISAVDALCDNNFSNEQKTKWIDRLEARIWTNILLISESDYDKLDYDADINRRLVVDSTHDAIYEYWLQSQIHLAHRDINEYNIMAEMFNESWEDYSAYIAFTYAPANFNNAATSLYYISPAGTLQYDPSDGYQFTYDKASDEYYLVSEIPADSIIRGVVCDLKTPFNSSGGDSLIIGTADEEDKFMAAGDIDETVIGVYEKGSWLESGALGTKIYAKITKSGIAATTGDALFYVLYMQK